MHYNCYLLTTAASSLGDVNKFAINPSIIKRSTNTRKTIVSLINLKTTEMVITAQCDSKFLLKFTNGYNLEQLMVKISGIGIKKIHGVPKLPNGTGKPMVKAVVDSLDEWNIKEYIQARSFDEKDKNWCQI